MVFPVAATDDGQQARLPILEVEQKLLYVIRQIMRTVNSGRQHWAFSSLIWNDPWLVTRNSGSWHSNKPTLCKMRLYRTRLAVSETAGCLNPVTIKVHCAFTLGCNYHSREFLHLE
jgi:hypothetical protein